MNEDELVKSFAARVQKIIELRQQVDAYVANKSINSSAHTYGAEEQARVSDEIKALTHQADCDIVLLDDLSENKGFVNRLRNVLKELME